MQYVIQYKIAKDENGLWCVQGQLSNGQETSKVYAKDTDALIQIFLMLEGSSPVFCPDEQEPHTQIA